MKYSATKIDIAIYTFAGIFIWGSIGALEVDRISMLQSFVQMVSACILMCLVRIHRVAVVRKKRVTRKRRDARMMDGDYDGDPISMNIILKQLSNN